MLILFKHYEENDDSYTIEEIAELVEEMKYYCNIISKKFNDVIIKYTDSAMFLGFDIIEISEQRNNLEYLNIALMHIKNGDILSLNKFMLNYNCGVTGAFEGYIDMNERIYGSEDKVEQRRKNENEVTNFWNWKFNKEKTYIVYSMTIFKESFNR